MLRPVMLWSHRWLGLGASVLLVIGGLTGALLLVRWPQPMQESLIQFHIDLLAGPAGAWAMLGASAAGVFLQLSGLYLWWRTKSLTLRFDRGWWRASYDLHNMVGVVGSLIMTLLVATAVARLFFRFVPMPFALEMLPRVNSRLHTAFGFPWPLQVLWGIGSFAFVVQTLSGALVWWRPSAKSRE